MVSGCCRKLKPGEAVVGKHGLQQTAAAPNVPAHYGIGDRTNSRGATQRAANQSGGAKHEEVEGWYSAADAAIIDAGVFHRVKMSTSCSLYVPGCHSW